MCEIDIPTYLILLTLSCLSLEQLVFELMIHPLLLQEACEVCIESQFVEQCWLTLTSNHCRFFGMWWFTLFCCRGAFCSLHPSLQNNADDIKKSSIEVFQHDWLILHSRRCPAAVSVLFDPRPGQNSAKISTFCFWSMCCWFLMSWLNWKAGATECQTVPDPKC